MAVASPSMSWGGARRGWGRAWAGSLASGAPCTRPWSPAPRGIPVRTTPKQATSGMEESSISSSPQTGKIPRRAHTRARLPLCAHICYPSLHTQMYGSYYQSGTGEGKIHESWTTTTVFSSYIKVCGGRVRFCDSAVWLESWAEIRSFWRIACMVVHFIPNTP